MESPTYDSFVEKTLAGAEGVFFSVKNDITGHKAYVGTGPKVRADFDTGPFPLFSVNSFDGKARHHWHFENFATVEIVKPTPIIPVLENFKTKLDLNDLAGFTGETKTSFVSKVERLQQAALAGEFWVANFTQKLSGRLPVDTDNRGLALKVFYEFLKLNKNHCGGVFVTNDQIFCSFSPEIFLIQNQQALRTFPIKGTGSEAALKASAKEQAELNMVTDLMRNDLGQICERVWVERERYLTEESGFFHARAEICGTLKNKNFTESNFKKLLPAGSISGAPKKRVLSLLKSLESFDRQYYTGTFGVRLNPEKSIFNILIRTLFLDVEKKEWSFPVGAGITIESNPKAEWEETLQKAQILKDCVS